MSRSLSYFSAAALLVPAFAYGSGNEVGTKSNKNIVQSSDKSTSKSRGEGIDEKLREERRHAEERDDKRRDEDLDGKRRDYRKDDRYNSAKRDYPPPEPVKPTFGLGLGVGLTPLPTSRFEFGWHTRWDLGFVSAGFEASSFSRNHWLARSLLLDTYAKDVQDRRLLLIWRHTADNRMSVGLGYENRVAKLLLPVSSDSKELKRIINADSQSFLASTGFESAGQFNHVRVVMEWLGISFRASVRDSNFTEKAPEASEAEVEKAKSDFLAESKIGLRFFNLSVFLDL